MQHGWFLRLVVVVVSLLLVLPVSPGAMAGPSPVSIRFNISASGSVAEAYQRIAQEFERTHPGIRVQVEIFAGSAAEYRQKMLTLIIGGVAPDIIYMHYSIFPEYAARGTLVNLTPYVKRENFDLSEYFPQTVAQMSYRGDLYAIPREMSSIALFYNKTLFDRAGLSSPDESWTWDTFLAAAKRLTLDLNRDGKTDQWGTILPTSWWTLFPVIYSFGGEVLNSSLTKCALDRPEAVRAIQFVSDLLHVHKVAITEEEARAINAFVNGRVGMFIGGYWDIAGVGAYVKDFEWDVAHMPKGKIRATRIASGGYSITATSKNPDEAWEFLKYLGSRGPQSTLAIIGWLMPALSKLAYASEITQAKQPPKNRRVFVDAVAYGRLDPSVLGFNDILRILDKELSLVWLGRATPQAAATTVTRAVDDEVLARTRTTK